MLGPRTQCGPRLLPEGVVLNPRCALSKVRISIRVRCRPTARHLLGTHVCSTGAYQLSVRPAATKRACASRHAPTRRGRPWAVHATRTGEHRGFRGRCGMT